jgi:integrase
MRPRKANRHLPPCVYLRHGAYYHVKNGKWNRLGTDLPTALAAYGRMHATPDGAMDTLIDNALEAMKPRLSPSTRLQYAICGRKLKAMLAEFSPEQVKPKDVAQIKLGMADTPNMANRVLSVLRQIFDYAVEQQLVDSNPALGIKRHGERKRRRLVTPEEFNAIRRHAGPRLQIIMDLWRLTGQRVVDVLRIRRADLRPEGIYFKQDKTDAELIVRWNPELRAVVEAAKTLNGNVKTLTLLHNRRGKAPDYSTVKGQWDDARRAAGVQDVQIRDLRAMSLTAAKRQGMNPTALAGHASEAMTRRYLRDREVPVVDGPSFGQVLDVGQKAAENQ